MTKEKKKTNRDPVCGMELDESSAKKRRTVEGTQVLFCSSTCEQKFLSHPEEYSQDLSSGRDMDDSNPSRSRS
jgi:YHS domain-containing protein